MLVVLLHARFSVVGPIPFLLAAIFFPGHPYNTSGNTGMGKDDIPVLVYVLFHPSMYLLPIQCPYLLCNNSTMVAYDSTSKNMAG